MKIGHFFILCAAPLLGANSCDPALNSNPNFEFWCDDTPCGWQLVDGRVERAPTWREGDDGVRLVGPKVVLEQTLDETRDCLAISVLTDVPDGASMVMEFDFQDDGNVEHIHPLDGQNWKHLDFQITPPRDYTALRVRIRKLGEPSATLARMRIGDGGTCLEAPIELAELADGIACTQDEQCASGTCVPDRYCDIIDENGFVPCRTDADCALRGSDSGCFDFPTGVCGMP
jgi:hypothetical protein